MDDDDAEMSRSVAARTAFSFQRIASTRSTLCIWLMLMALDPEEIVTLLLLAALAIAWNWKFRH
jgi:hypothetical protein